MAIGRHTLCGLSLKGRSAFQPGFARLALDPDRRLDGRCCSQLDLVTDQRDPGLEVTLDGFDRALSAHCQRQGCMEFDRSTLYGDAEPAVANSMQPCRWQWAERARSKPS